MIDIVDIIELRMEFIQNGYTNLSTTLINNILNNDAFQYSPKALNVYYLIEQIASQNDPYTQNNIDALIEDSTTFISTYFDFLSEDEQELFFNLIFSRFLFAKYQSFDEQFFLNQINKIENNLLVFKDYTALDGIFITKEELKVQLLRLYDILINTTQYEQYTQKSINLIEDIRINKRQRQLVQDLIDKLEVNV